MNGFNETLKSVGLTDSEVSVYTELSTLGKATIVELTKHLKMHRPNIYEALKKLVSKGLVSNNASTYYVNDFEKLLDYVEVKRTELDEKKMLLKALMPQRTEESRPKVTLYEGVDALKSVFEEMLRTAKINHCIGAWDKPYIMEWFFKNWHNRRAMQGFTDKLLFSETGRARGNELSKIPNTQVRYLDKNTNSPLAINVYENKAFLIIGSVTNPIGVLIDDLGVSKDFMDYFKLLWDNAKE